MKTLFSFTKYIVITQIIQTKRNVYLIMEYAEEGELFKYIVAKGTISELESCKIYQQIISAMEYIHSMRITHRDVKPENILLDNNKTIKIADFGLSNSYKTDELLSTPCGSPFYASPEMVTGKSYSGMKTDIWSSGITLFAMLCGYLPFEDENNDDLFRKIKKGEYQVSSKLTEIAKDFLSKILEVDPVKRFDFRQIKQHDFFKLSPFDGSTGIKDFNLNNVNKQLKLS